MTKKMLIDATHPEETRVVVLDGNKVDNFDFESINKKQLAGNIYLAKVTRVEPSLQAAFVDYGGNRHGFLAFSEIHPDYYQIPVADREAILAEEEREVAAEAAAEAADAGDTPAPKKRSRSRKTKTAETEARAAEQSGAEDKAASADGAEEEGTKPARSRRGRRKSGQRKGGTTGGLDVIDLESGDGNAQAEPLGAPSAADAPAEQGAAQAPAAPTETAGQAEGPPPEAAAGPEAPAPVDRAVAEEAGSAGPDALEAALATVPEDSAAAEPAPELPQEETLAGLAETPVPETPGTAEPGTPAAEAADTPPGQDTDAPDPDDDTGGGGGPRSIAESAGLDEDVVTEEVGEGEDTPQDKPRARRSRGGRSGRSGSGKSGKGTRAKNAEDEPGEDKPKSRSRKARTAPAEAEEEDAATGEIETAGAEDIRDEVSRERAIRRRRYKIQDVIKVRQILLVQIVKEERGNKGAALTTYLSLAGRYCVLMPNTARGGGISRKITNATDRKRLREIVGEMEVPRGMGLIVRTAGAERTRPEIKRDYEFLLRQWEQIRELTLKSIAPTLIYEEGSLIKRSIRDLYSKEIESVLVEGEAGYKEAKAYMKMLMPSHARNVKQYSDTVPLFIRYQVESYLNAMFSPVVQLKSGGYIVIGVTEALVAIDVNSGRSTKEGSVEDTAVKTNLEAADEVARQLRLRDLAGLIVIDFIDMDERRNNASVEKRMKERLKTDRARIQIGRISAFGLMEMSRQRLRPGMLEASTKPCPHCHGTGTIRSDDSLALAILREVEEQAIRADAAELTVTTPVEIANFLINAKRAHVAMIEERHGVTVAVYGDPAMTSPDFKVERSRAKPREVEARSQSVSAGPDAVADAEPEPVEEAEVVGEGQAEIPRSGESSGDDESKRARRRRGKRGGRRRRAREDETDQPQDEAASGAGAPESAEAAEPAGADGAEAAQADGTGETPAPEADAEPETKPRSRTRRSRAKGKDSRDAGETGEAAPTAAVSTGSPESPADAEPARDETASGADAAAPADQAPDAAAQPGPAASDRDAPGSAAASDAPAQADTGDAPAGAGSGPDPAEPGQVTVGENDGAKDEAESRAKPKRRGWWTLGF